MLKSDIFIFPETISTKYFHKFASADAEETIWIKAEET